MSSLLIKNIGTLVTGKLESPLRQANSIFIKDGIVQAIGNDLNQKGGSSHQRQRNHGDSGIDRFASVDRRLRAVPTPSATNVGQASTDAVREIVHDLFAG
jgi:hypothetical protein